MPDGAVLPNELASVITSCAGANVDAATLRDQPAITFEELGVDSLGVLGVITELENRYAIRIGTDAEACRSPHELLVLINTALSPETNHARTH